MASLHPFTQSRRSLLPSESRVGAGGVHLRSGPFAVDPITSPHGRACSSDGVRCLKPDACFSELTGTDVQRRERVKDENLNELVSTAGLFEDGDELAPCGVLASVSMQGRQQVVGQSGTIASAGHCEPVHRTPHMVEGGGSLTGRAQHLRQSGAGEGHGAGVPAALANVDRLLQGGTARGGVPGLLQRPSKVEQVVRLRGLKSQRSSRTGRTSKVRRRFGVPTWASASSPSRPSACARA